MILMILMIQFNSARTARNTSALFHSQSKKPTSGERVMAQVNGEHRI